MNILDNKRKRAEYVQERMTVRDEGKKLSDLCWPKQSQSVSPSSRRMIKKRIEMPCRTSYWLRRLLRQLNDMSNVVIIVSDNATIHVDLEPVMEEPEFIGATLCRAVSNSAPLNPIEECLTIMKSAMKRNHGPNSGWYDFNASWSDSEGTSSSILGTYHRPMQAITSLVCLHTCNYVQNF